MDGAVIETGSTLRQRAGREGSGGLLARELIGLSISVPRRLASESNGKRATAAVTRYGCWRGEFFEGCELRYGERAGEASRSGPVLRRREGWRDALFVKRDEPCLASGCNISEALSMA